MIKLDRLFAVAAAGALALDLWTKQLVLERFALGESLPLLPGLALTYVRNPGAAFSMLANASPALRLPFFLGVVLLATVAIFWMLRQTEAADRVTRFGLGLVLGGALGNGVDRVRFGEVVDFIEVGVRSVYVWPIFNAADSAVCVGVALLLWRSWRPMKGDDASSPA